MLKISRTCPEFPKTKEPILMNVSFANSMISLPPSDNLNIVMSRVLFATNISDLNYVTDTCYSPEFGNYY